MIWGVMELKGLFSRFSGLFWRVAMLAFAVSLILPSPAFLRGMSGEAVLVWAFRLLWVAGLSGGVAVIVVVAGCLRGRKPGPRPGR